MGDPLSTAASLIAVVQISGSIISLCFDYKRSVNTAQRDASRLLSETKSLRNVIERLLDLLDEQRAVVLDEKTAVSIYNADGPEEDDSYGGAAINSLSNPDSDGSPLPALQSLTADEDAPISRFLEELTILEGKLNRPVTIWRQKQSSKLPGMIMKLKWPLVEREFIEALDGIGRLRGIIELALATDNTAVILDSHRTIKDVAYKVGDILESQTTLAVRMRTDRKSVDNAAAAERQRKERQKVFKWLGSPGHLAAKHRDVCSRRAKDTAGWLLESAKFAAWLRPERPAGTSSSFWLHGIPGCGKTVLASAVIERIANGKRSNSLAAPSALGYFYFDFGNQAMSQPDKMLRSLIVQLAAGSGPLPEALYNCARKHLPCSLDDTTLKLSLDDSGSEDDHPQPTQEELLETLQNLVYDMAKAGTDVFIVLDALDECVDQDALHAMIPDLMSLNAAAAPGDGHLRIFLTSRPTPELTHALSSTDYTISADPARVGDDIDTFIREQLTTHPKLRRWPVRLRNEIQESLTDGARGMFRWVDCQLGMLQKCVTIKDARKALSVLPSSLSETYARTISGVEEFHREYAVRVLLWLAVSQKPLDLRVAGDILAVDMDGEGDIDEDTFFFDEEMRVPDLSDIPSMCTTLVRTIESTNPDNPLETIVELHLSHYTVQEYLLSPSFLVDYLQHDDCLSPSVASLSSVCLVHEYLARTMLRYLLSLQEPLTENLLNDRPLARTASERWPLHFRSGQAGKLLNESDTTSLDEQDESAKLAMKLLCPEYSKDTAQLSVFSEAYKNWCRLFDPNKSWRPPDLEKTEFRDPLYYASLEGMDVPVRLLLQAGADPNVGGGMHKSSLQAAAYHGHLGVVRALLKAGADPNHGGGLTTFPLVAAVASGHADVVAELLKYGANTDSVKFKNDGTPLMEACRRNNVGILRQLLAANASPNVYHRKMYQSNPVDIASRRGYEECLSVLLPYASRGTIHSGFNSAFSVSLFEQLSMEEDKVKNMMRIFAAYVPGTVLDKATRFGYTDIVDEILRVPSTGTPAEATAGMAQQDAALLNRRRKAIDPKIAMSFLDACKTGQVDFAETMLVNGIVESDTPLEEEVGRTTFALFEAVKLRNTALAEMLIKHGADADACSNTVYGLPLARAAHNGDLEMVRLLVEKGDASIKRTKSRWGSPLQAAIVGESLDVVKYLLAIGAKVNQVADPADELSHRNVRCYKTPIQLATSWCSSEIMDCLLASGADPNLILEIRHADGRVMAIDDGQPRAPLGVAAFRGDLDKVDILLQYGARVNSYGSADAEEDPGSATYDDPALYWAILGQSPPAVKRLLEAGADANAVSRQYGTKATMLSIACQKVGHGKRPGDEIKTEHDAVAIVKELLRAGADPTRYSQLHGHEEPPLQTLIRCGGQDDASINAVVRELVYNYGVDMHATAAGGEGWTALQQAARHGHASVIYMMVNEMGADPNRQLVNGSCVVHAAAFRNQPECLDVLFMSGRTDINTQNFDGRTPMHMAADSGAADSIAWLLGHGADTTLVEFETGMTAEDYAVLKLQQILQSAKDHPEEATRGSSGWDEDTGNTVANRTAVVDLFKRHAARLAVQSNGGAR